MRIEGAFRVLKHKLYLAEVVPFLLRCETGDVPSGEKHRTPRRGDDAAKQGYKRGLAASASAYDSEYFTLGDGEAHVRKDIASA